MPLTPVVCPNDRLPLCPKGTQPRAWGCTWESAGESQPRTATVATGLGATGNVLPLCPLSDKTPGSGPGHSPALSLWQASLETWPDSSTFHSVPCSLLG